MTAVPELPNAVVNRGMNFSRGNDDITDKLDDIVEAQDELSDAARGLDRSVEAGDLEAISRLTVARDFAVVRIRGLISDFNNEHPDNMCDLIGRLASPYGHGLETVG